MPTAVANVNQCLLLRDPSGVAERLYCLPQRLADGKVWQRPDNLDAQGEIIPPGHPTQGGTFVPLAEADRARGTGFGRAVGTGFAKVFMDVRLPDGQYRFLVYLAVTAGQRADADPLFRAVVADRPWDLINPTEPTGGTVSAAPRVVTPAVPRTVRAVQS